MSPLWLCRISDYVRLIDLGLGRVEFIIHNNSGILWRFIIQLVDDIGQVDLVEQVEISLIGWRGANRSDA